MVWKAVNDARMTKSPYSAEFRVLHRRWHPALGRREGEVFLPSER